MKSQKKMVLEYIREFGSITSLDAFKDLGITRLSAVIFDLRESGYNIFTDIEHSKNRFGHPTRYARYSLLGGWTDKLDDSDTRGGLFDTTGE